MSSRFGSGAKQAGGSGDSGTPIDSVSPALNEAGCAVVSEILKFLADLDRRCLNHEVPPTEGEPLE